MIGLVDILNPMGINKFPLPLKTGTVQNRQCIKTLFLFYPFKRISWCFFCSLKKMARLQKERIGFFVLFPLLYS